MQYIGLIASLVVLVLFPLATTSNLGVRSIISISIDLLVLDVIKYECYLNVEITFPKRKSPDLLKSNANVHIYLAIV